MKLGFVPSAIPAIANWADTRPDDVWRALQEAQSGREVYTRTGRIDGVRLVEVDKITRHSIAVGYDAGVAIVFAAQSGLILAMAQTLATRLSRTNWAQHMLSLDTTGLEPDELITTLTQAISAIDLTEPVKSRLAGAIVDPEIGRFIDQIGAHARPWRSSDARGDFKGLMDAASGRPQRINRPGGEEVYVVSKQVMQDFSRPKSAAQLVETYANRAVIEQIPIVKRPPPRGTVGLTDLRATRKGD